MTKDYNAAKKAAADAASAKNDEGPRMRFL